MSRSAFPDRPRLADHALARRHLTGDGEVVVLHDTRTGGLIRLGPREWGLLACADGTRDLEGILLAAARGGAHARVEALRGFLEQLHAAGLITDGPGDGPERGPDVGPATPGDLGPTPPDRALDVLPGFTLTCDGSGSCCRIYASVIFSPTETARARGLLPRVLDGGGRPDRIFLPERGSVRGGGSAVALSNGRCAYLAGDGRCTIHAAAGENAKPIGCLLFPVTFVDDGAEVRVSVAVECACVLASVGRGGGAPLVPQGARVRADLDEGAFITSLPAEVLVTSTATAPRADLAGWSRCVAAASSNVDSIARLHALRRASLVAGLDEPAARRALDEPALPSPGELLPWIEALAARAARRARDDETWRDAADLARLSTRWIHSAATALLAPGVCAELLAAPGNQAAESFYVRAAVHGHQLISDLPLVHALRDRVVRILVARALPRVLPEGAADPACAQPLALVEAMLRGHGLEAYAHDVSEGAS